jgi:hypothetical protein
VIEAGGVLVIQAGGVLVIEAGGVLVIEAGGVLVIDGLSRVGPPYPHISGPRMLGPPRNPALSVLCP